MVSTRTIIWQTILVAALTGLLGGSGWLQAMMGSVRGAVRPWQIVTSPNTPGAATNQLLGVTALSAHNIWAVGQSGSPAQALIEYFDGRSWIRVNSASVPDATGTGLQAVAGVGPRDVWAVGSAAFPTAPTTRTLIERFDGGSWTKVDSPNKGEQNFLHGVVALSPRNIWAVGFFQIGSTFQTLIEHFDGRSWSIVDSPNVAGEANVLNDVSAVSPYDIWAVGSFGPFGSVGLRTLVEHFDGTQWRIVTSANVPNRGNQLDAVAAASPHNVWAVGFQIPAEEEDKPLQMLIEHFDGREWRVETILHVGTGDNHLSGVAIASPRDIWAVGFAGDEALIEHFDGRGWSAVSSPPASEGTRNLLVGVTALSAQHTWAVGFTVNLVSSTSATLIERQVPSAMNI